MKRALVHQLHSPITHDDSENDDLTNDSDLFDVDDNPNNNKNVTINKINKYYGNTSKSVFFLI